MHLDPIPFFPDDVDVDLGDDDVKLAPETKPPNEQIASAEGCGADVLEARPRDAPEEDDRMIVSTRNLRRLRKQTTASDAATEDINVIEVTERLNDDEATNLAPCGELKCRNTAEDAFNGVIGSKAVVEEETMQSPSDDVLYRSVHGEPVVEGSAEQHQDFEWYKADEVW